ncbi:hypothetical protein QAD02_023891 [Eretmocerus hayati]|uniref:Uncharacterized protein n=1 Tax=Eretmocerus hayati TaxID=131215 RepID=A0ACC2PYT2_9HYME|nr:hypothetical protein QAD02_023891 [Eretmocerus hayati]
MEDKENQEKTERKRKITEIQGGCSHVVLMKKSKKPTPEIDEEADEELSNQTLNLRDDLVNVNDSHEGDDDTGYDYDVSSFVIVDYEGEYFPGIIKQINEHDGSAEVSVMVMRGLDWGWPDKVDQVWYKAEDIKDINQEPQQIKSRGNGRLIDNVPEITKYRGKLSK